MKSINIVLRTLWIITMLLSVIIILTYRYHTKKLMKKLLGIIESAMDGTFNENTYDESLLSSLESKLSRYITYNYLHCKDLTKDKDEINSLISDISHQTKTPIANIMLYAELLSEQQELSLESKEIANQVIEQTEKLNFLVGSLLKTSRLETGIISVNPKKESVKDLVELVLNEVSLKAKDKGIAIVTNINHSKARFDLKWTVEALYNIVDNAIKYTNSGGKVEIVTADYELFLRIDVSDNGMGISENEHNKIFSRFYRSKDVDYVEGVGIGLFLSRKIISTQGGYIKLKSAKGEGATFSIFLPYN